MERAQKIFLEPCGVFEWQKPTPDSECHCRHLQSAHLDLETICLTGLCICEKFGVDKKVEVLAPTAIARKNFPEKFAAHFNRN